MNTIDQLKEYLEDANKRRFILPKWISDDRIAAYVRKGHHILPDTKQLMTTLDIANVIVSGKYRRQGIFKNFLAEAHNLNPWYATFVENILNQVLIDYLRREKWLEIKGTPDSSPSFYLKR